MRLRRDTTRRLRKRWPSSRPQLLDELTLDAQVEDGKVNFFLASPGVVSSPEGHDDETQARHDASPAETLAE